MISINDVHDAAQRINKNIIRTPTLFCQSLSKRVNADITLKLENLQAVGSFKERGAANRLALLTEEEKTGVITVSAGNHAQGVARHAQLLGIDAIIVMPKFTPVTKINRTAAWGAKIVLEGEDFTEATQYANQLAKEDGRVFIHPYDDPAVMAGQGTLALEIFEDTKSDLDYLIVPVGGGGLISGCAVVAAALRPYTKIIGVQSDRYFSYSFATHKALKPPGGATIAEGIAVRKLGFYPFEVIEKYVEDIVSVPEEAIEDSITLVAEHAKQITEGAGASGLAAILTYPERFKGKNIAFPISGGNIDTRILANTLLRTLLREGRLLRLRFSIPDRPGVLADISHIIGTEKGGNIIEVSHQRLFSTSSVQSAILEIMAEARSAEHAEEIIQSLREKYTVERI